MRDIKPLLIALLAVGLVGTWVYHLYDKTLYSQQINTLVTADSTAVNKVRDSMYQAVAAMQKDFGGTLDSLSSENDSMKVKMELKIREIKRLRSQIAEALGKKDLNRDDLEKARTLILQLKDQVAELNGQNTDLETQHRELQVTFNQLSANADSLAKNMSRLNQENAVMREKIEQGSVFIASDVRLTAVTVKGDKDQETGQAKKAEKLLITFAIQNNMNAYDNEQMMIVIIQPDDKVLQNINWNSGSFDTKSAGRKAFTRVVKFDYERAERKDFRFSLQPDTFQKGTYNLQLWHQGVLIGQAQEDLN